MQIKTTDIDQILKSALDVLPYELILMESDCCILFLNTACQKKLGFSLDELQGREIYSILSVENPVGLMEKLLKHLERSTWQGELTFTNKSNEDIPLQIFAEALRDDSGKIIGYLFTTTERLPALNTKTTAEESLQKDEEATDTQLLRNPVASVLVRRLTHRLNNPLVGVFNFTQLLLEKLTPKDPLYEIAQTIYEAANDCKEIIEQWRRFYLNSSDGDDLDNDTKS